MLPANELLKFQFPKVKELEVVIVQLEDGTIVARTVEELEVAKGKEETEGEE